jgi:hypothetical protein
VNHDEAHAPSSPTPCAASPPRPTWRGAAQALQDELDLDSMDFLNLMVGIHEQTGVEVPERDYPKVAHLDGLLDYLVARG